jgi:hypothetical protein
MKSDPTIRDVVQGVRESLREAPARILDTKVSRIRQTIWSIVRLVILTGLYVGVVLAIGELQKLWWHVPNFYYVAAFVLIPLSHLREWWGKRRQSDKVA